MDNNFIVNFINAILDLIRNILSTLGVDTEKVPSIDVEEESTEATA